jgi:hypothetical protein
MPFGFVCLRTGIKNKCRNHSSNKYNQGTMKGTGCFVHFLNFQKAITFPLNLGADAVTA